MVTVTISAGSLFAFGVVAGLVAGTIALVVVAVILSKKNK
jgi:TRAP-type C4-dicarboxylate transport system permease large subunit